jgi:hypothetical protein
MARPDSTEYVPYYEKYIALVPENDIVKAMKSAPETSLGFLTRVSDSEACVCHSPYTWTIKQVVGHLADSERVFGYRALRFARGDGTPLSGFDENAYARAIRLDEVPLGELVAEFASLRRSHVSFFEHLSEEAWQRRGIANNDQVTVRALAYILIGHERHHASILRNRLAQPDCS